MFGLTFGVLFLRALIGGISTTLLLYTSFSGTFLRTLYLCFFGTLPVLVLGYISVYLNVRPGWKMGLLKEVVLLMALLFGVNAWKLVQKK